MSVERERFEIGSLTFVGTGLLATGHTTSQALGYLREADKVFHVLAEPVTRMWLEDVNPTAESLLDAYAEGKPRRETYREMVGRILEPVRRGLRVCVAFYGHPGVFVNASHDAIRRARDEGHDARMLPGISAADCLYADLGVDPATDGCHSFEATDFLVRRRRFDPRSALVLWQIGAIGVDDFRKRQLWNRAGLAVLAEVLCEHYPADHEAVLYEAALFPVCDPRIERVSLVELARADVSIASTLYVPPRERAPIDPEMAQRLSASSR